MVGEIPIKLERAFELISVPGGISLDEGIYPMIQYTSNMSEIAMSYGSISCGQTHLDAIAAVSYFVC
jgi:hypothetical protein